MGDISSLKPQHLLDITKQLWKLQKRFFPKFWRYFVDARCRPCCSVREENEGKKSPAGKRKVSDTRGGSEASLLK